MNLAGCELQPARRFVLAAVAVALSALLVGPPASAQVGPQYFDYARPTLEWYTIETDHFNVIFHHDSSGRGASRTAQVVARIAEETYSPITSLYGLEPEGRVSIILKDFEDYSNGAAYFFDNKLEIWASALDSPLRGDHNWLRNVITHEFTHIVQVQKTMKASRHLPFIYFQYLGYEDVKRPDVLYGYPDAIVTYPVPVLNNPVWLAEGTAQYQRSFMNYDSWDTHRDMLLRTRVLAGEELDLEEMGGFYSHSSLLRESVYNHGFALTHYLANSYGEDVLRDLSASLGKWRNWNVERAIEDATGDEADEVYHRWMQELRSEYTDRTAEIRRHVVEGELLEDDGFSNFHARFSPDGRRLAYVSNRGEHYNLMSLYLKDVETGETVSLNVDGLSDGASYFTCSMGHAHKVRSGVGSAVTWHPSGDAIVYARTKDTPKGFRYSDLYRLNLESDEEERLTTGARAFAPAYSPDAEHIAYVVQSDGTANLHLLDTESGESRALTAYQDGSQVTDPAWHPNGKVVYFGLSRGGGRDIYRIELGESRPEPVIATEADERSPVLDASHLYYSSDESGIFNLYRAPLEGGEPERLTNVVGGAFLPDVREDGAIAFSRYDWDGYKIALLAEPAGLSGDRLASYSPPPVTQKTDTAPLADAEWGYLASYDDTDLGPLSGSVVTGVQTTGSFPLTGLENGAADTEEEAAEIEEYSNIFTSFSIYPVVRLDDYASRRETAIERRLPQRSYAETLLRNTKVGIYASSREILEGMSLFGGLAVGPGSRDASSASDFFSPSNLLKLERDAFLIFDYNRGFGFLSRRWSPQISIELYNVRRNVENGLSVEEFPCTACFPDTTLVDLSYSLWEADVFARSKIRRDLLLEVGYRYSPYRVITDRFFSKESDAFVGETASRYFIGRAFTFGGYYRGEHPHRDAGVLPEKLQIEAHYEIETGRLLDQFDVEDGALVPSYERAVNHRVTLDGRLGVRLPGEPLGGSHGVGLRLRGSTILGAEVDGFYNDYVGGLIGARGYPFYALGGNETLWLQAAYHFPILPDISKQVLFTYFDKLYGRAYADAALAWSGGWPGLGEVRKDVGLELRLGLGSFYLLPTSLFVSATYGMDAFDFRLDEGFLTPDGSNTVRYGNELLWHFGILFDFEL